MTFTITRLVGARAVVQGTDRFGTHGSVVVDTTQWDEVNASTAFDKATEAFEHAVEEFFKPLTEATEKINRSLNKPNDPLSYVVLKEGVEATPGQAEQLIKLNHDSIVLRLVEENSNTDRLMWVNDQLEVLEADTPLPFGADESDDSAYDTEAVRHDEDGNQL